MRSYPLDFLKEIVSVTLPDNSSSGSSGDLAQRDHTASPLPNTFSKADYYQSFIPLILLESEAIIRDEYQNQKGTDFTLTIEIAQREGDHLHKLVCDGLIPQELIKGKGNSMHVVCIKGGAGNHVVAVAFQERKRVTLFMDENHKEHVYGGFSVHYLCTLLNQQRMFDACRRGVKLPYLEELAAARIPDPVVGSSSSLVKTIEPSLSHEQIKDMVMAHLEVPSNIENLVIITCDNNLKALEKVLKKPVLHEIKKEGVKKLRQEVGNALQKTKEACDAFEKSIDDGSWIHFLQDLLSSVGLLIDVLKRHHYRPTALSKALNILTGTKPGIRRGAVNSIYKEINSYHEKLKRETGLFKKVKDENVYFLSVSEAVEFCEKHYAEKNYPKVLMVDQNRRLNREEIDKYSIFFKDSFDVIPSDMLGLLPEDSHLNESQRQAVNAFLSTTNPITVLQGPPGTGKTTTIVSLLQQLENRPGLTIVTAPSNKAVQLIAQRYHQQRPDANVLLAAIGGKMPSELEAISFYDAYDQLDKAFDKINDDIESAQESLENEKKPDNLKEILALFWFIIRRVRKFENSDTRVATNTKTIFNFDPESSDIVLCKEIIDRLEKAIDGAHWVFLSSNNRLARGFFEKKLLSSTNILFATLPVLGQEVMLSTLAKVKVGHLVLDEASQCEEAQTQLALQHNPQRILLAGDTKQLPATVTSQEAERRKFGRSMMSRLAEDNECPTLMLDTQYRMHPEICRWPAKQYYKGLLKTDTSIQAKREAEHSAGILKSPRLFVNVASGKEGRERSSYVNYTEMRVVVDLIRHIRQKDKESSIGVITFYSGQVALLNRSIPRELKKNLLINTVDGFQGGERDIIIVSCVRTQSVGFLKDARRLNVAMTRARKNLLVVGNESCLLREKTDFKLMVQDMKEKKQVISEQEVKEMISGRGLSRDNRSSRRDHSNRSHQDHRRYDHRSRGGGSKYGGGSSDYRREVDSSDRYRHSSHFTDRRSSARHGEYHFRRADGGKRRFDVFTQGRQRSSREPYDPQRASSSRHSISDAHRNRPARSDSRVYEADYKRPRPAGYRSHQGGKTNTWCKFFGNAKGGCRKGENCDYRHY